MTTQYQQNPFFTNGKSYQRAGEPSINKNSGYSIIKIGKKLWRRLQFNEWTFTFILFLFSLSIVIGKLFFNYDSFNYFEARVEKMPVHLINKSHPYYQDIIHKSVIKPVYRYSWLIKALLCGLITTAITWITIYQDSSIPGVNPPAPFSPSKKRISESSPFQINYLVGVLNGFLIFVYMCL